MNDLKVRKILKYLLYFVAFVPILLFSGYSFPYVTFRTVIFRALMEAICILVLWLYLEGKIKFANLKNNYFFWIFGTLLLLEFIAAIIGESFIVSFWSDMERMWGIFTLIHLFLFYFGLRAFFQEKEWKVFLNISFVVSLLVSLYGIIQRFPQIFQIYVFEAGISRISSTLGNATYVAIYLIFNILFAFYFLLKERECKGKYQYFYATVILIDFFAFSLTDIRGAYLGFILGILSAAVLYLFLGKNKKYKTGAGTLIALSFLCGVLIFWPPTKKLVANIPILNRLSTISLSATTAKTRFMGWNAAWQGFKERPFFGVGIENYNVVFNKYFNASYYNLAPTETYFDRAHNQFLNILVESGIFAFLIYLIIPLLLFYYLARSYKKEKIGLSGFLTFTALTIAYFVHVFFVFDDINSFLFLLILAAFIESMVRENNLIVFEEGKRSNLSNYLAFPAIIILLFAIYNYNYKILKVSKLSASAYLSEDFKNAVGYYNDSLNENITPIENIVVKYVDYLTDFSNELDKIKNDKEYKELFEASFKRLEKALEEEINKKPNDVFLYMKFAELDNLQFLYFQNEKYSGRAAQNLKKAITLSPERLQLYYILGETYVISGQNNEARVILERALSLNPNFNASYYYLGRAYMANKELDKAFDYMVTEAIVKRKFNPEDNKILIFLAMEYAKGKKYEKVVKIYETIVMLEPQNADIMAALSASYIQTGQYDKAIETAKKTAEIDPAFKREADLFINLIERGEIDELKKITQ